MRVEYIVIHLSGKRTGTCSYDSNTNEVYNFDIDDYEEEDIGDFFFDYIVLPNGQKLAVEDHLNQISLVCGGFDGFCKVRNYWDCLKALEEFDWMKEGF